MTLQITERKLARPKYYAVEDLRKVICTTQRAGSTSMIEAMQPRPGYPESAVRQVEQREVLKLRAEGWLVLMWIRDPLHRFASAYSIFGKGRIPVSREINRKKYQNPGEFLQVVRELTDAHWAPMTRLHMHKGVFLPTKVYAFDDLKETWGSEMPGYYLRHINPSKRQAYDRLAMQMSRHEIEALRKHYSEDTKMLNWCRENGYMENAA